MKSKLLFAISSVNKFLLCPLITSPRSAKVITVSKYTAVIQRVRKEGRFSGIFVENLDIVPSFSFKCQTSLVSFYSTFIFLRTL